MRFRGQHDRIQPQKLPDGIAQKDQNSWHHVKGMWQPRQGLSRPVGIGVLSGAVDAVGFGECGLKTGLILSHADKIEGYAIAAADVTPTWEAPPRRGWYTPEPTVSAVQGDVVGEIDVTITISNVYVVAFTIYRDGEEVGTATATPTATPTGGTPSVTGTFTDTGRDTGTTYSYTAEAQYDDGTVTAESAPSSVTTTTEWIYDAFLYSDGELGAVSSGIWTAELLAAVVESGRLTTTNDQGDYNMGAESIKRPYTMWLTVDWTNVATGGFRYYHAAIGGDGFDPSARVSYTYSSNTWKLEARVGVSVQSTATQAGVPPNATLILTVAADGTTTATYSSLSKTHSVKSTRTVKPFVSVRALSSGAGLYVDNFYCHGTTP
jgi:hypothetical protein